MATIRPNDNAPAEKAKYILPTATFDLASGGTFETEDRSVLADAEAHPWLEVEYPEQVEVSYTRAAASVPYEDDYLAAVNSQAFNADAVREVEEAKAGVSSTAVAIDAGLDQGKSVTVGEGERAIAVTHAADSSDNDDKTASGRSAVKKGD